MPIRSLLLSLLIAAAAFAEQGTVTGSVVDSSGAAVAGARIKLQQDPRAPDQETLSLDSGQFTFLNVLAGSYRITFEAKGFTVKTMTGELREAENLALPQTVLAVAPLTTDVNISENTTAIAQAQIREQEHQRLGGLVPNFFVSYDPDAAPLNTRQKFELTWKTVLDPASFVITGWVAGISQARNSHAGFGQGAQGYAKRYGAAYGDFLVGSVISGVVMPAVFHQDPRYFYKGTGTTRSRVRYALSRSLICRGDNKKEQFCYSSFVSRFGSGAITNYLYPAGSRNSVADIFVNAAIGIGGDALGNLVQEFVFKKVTPKKH